MTDFVLVDTSVVSRLTKADSDSAIYLRYLGGRRMAISFQTEAELLSAGFGEARQTRLAALLGKMTVIGHQRRTSECFAQVSETRRRLKKSNQTGGDAADDRHQVALARATGVSVLTTIPALAADNPDPA